MQIFVHRQEEQLGPFTEAEVKAQIAAGQLAPEDHVWWDGQDGWVPLGQSPRFASAFTEIPDASSESEPEPEAESEIPAEEVPASTERVKKRKKTRGPKIRIEWVIGAILLSLILIAAIAYYTLSSGMPDLNALNSQVATPTYQIDSSAPAPDPSAPAPNPTPTPISSTPPQLTPLPTPATNAPPAP
jgi:hypothetical protein